MGDKKRRMARRQEFFKAQPRCVYCGATATTTDHCPPRSFFERRQWPETYDYPACEPCNASARLDEQALAVLFRSKLTEGRSEADQLEWEKLLQGVKNNQPHLVAEWTDIARNEIKRGLIPLP
jgi:5-methylcytosine-specific restriction endonuclease McrA